MLACPKPSTKQKILRQTPNESWTNKYRFSFSLSNKRKGCILEPKFEISVNTDISVLRFYGYIENINAYFNKNINRTKIVQNS